MWNISSSAADALFAWSNIVLTVGAAAVLVGTIGSIKFAAVREHFADIRISDNERATKQAIADGDKAKAAAAEANARALEARLELEKFKSARSLAPDQQKEIAAKLQRFAGTIFDAAVGPMGDPEPIVFLRTLEPCLISAGWKSIPWTGGGMVYTEDGLASIGIGSVTNVIVDVAPGSWDRLGPAAQALAVALVAAGIDAIASRSSNINNDAIHIRIGRKL
jgi:hypothetical protein